MSSASTLAPESSGVYRAPHDLAALTRRAAASRAAWLRADLAEVRDKPGLLLVLAGVFGFPRSFGHNWDALSDSLQDLSWHPAGGYVLRLDNCAGARRRIGADWDILLEILRESAMYWKARDKPFIVIADDAEDLPRWT
jgi:hypothetical protein